MLKLIQLYNLVIVICVTSFSNVYAESLTIENYLESYDENALYSSAPKAKIDKNTYETKLTSQNSEFTQIDTIKPKKNNLFVKFKTFFQLLVCKLKDTCVDKHLQKSEEFQLLIPPLLAQNGIDGYYSRFLYNPFSIYIPDTVKEVYTWDNIWNPELNPETYLQCTAFVLMIYYLNGFRLRGKVRGDAKDWIYLTDTFDVFKSGSATNTSPKVFDTIVWAERKMNHAGVIVEVNEKRKEFKVLNANSTQTEYWFRYSKNKKGKIIITDLQGRTFKDGFVPSHWLRLKKEIVAQKYHPKE